MASKLNPRASRLDLRPDLRVMMYPIKLDQREMAALAEINRQYRDGDIQVYTGTDRNTLARIVGAKTLDTGVEFLLGMDRVSGRYLAAPVEWVEQVARMTAVAIDQGMIPEPPEDPEPPPMPRSKGRTPGRSAFPGGKMRNPSLQIGDRVKYATKWLQSMGGYTAAASAARGVVVDMEKILIPFGSGHRPSISDSGEEQHLITVEWGNYKTGTKKELSSNLEKLGTRNSHLRIA